MVGNDVPARLLAAELGAGWNTDSGAKLISDVPAGKAEELKDQQF